jgi:predicted dehydrogenase
MDRYNWGIIGLGKIANLFAQDLNLSKRGNLYAVASRSEEKAKTFANTYGAEKFYGSYEDLAADKQIDTVYIASPHVFHHSHTVMCLEAGKHVLCEKPVGMNAEEVRDMVRSAQKHKRLLTDALWTRWIPATEKVLDLIKSGTIGRVKMIKADFGFKPEYDPASRLFNMTLGGGSLLDIGIYPVFLSLLILGVPDEIKALALKCETGADIQCGMVFKYNSDQLSLLDSSLVTETATEAWIYGDSGAVKMHGRFHHAKTISLYKHQKLQDSFHIDYVGNGYYHEIEAFMSCLDEGLTESKEMPLSFSEDLIMTLDRIRKQIDLNY